jgi:hypothetical protein
MYSTCIHVYICTCINREKCQKVGPVSTFCRFRASFVNYPTTKILLFQFLATEVGIFST